MTINLRPVLFPIGLMIAFVGLAMLIPATIDAAYANADWQAFIYCAIISIIVGGAVCLITRTENKQINIRQAFLLTTLAWITVAFFGCLPFIFADIGLDFASAYFESMSGLTTTGSTVMTNLDNTPPGILMWRAILQWLGGIGVLVMAISIMPMLQVGGMQLYQTEGFYTSEKVLPQAAQISVWISAIYIGLTFACGVAYLIAGMNWFDATAHAMSTIATGGYSTKDESIGYFDSEVIDLITVVFMLLAALPFINYISLLQGKPQKLWYDSQVRTFLAIVAFLLLGAATAQIVNDINHGFDAFVYGIFNVVSVLTGTGYSTFDYSGWGGFVQVMFFCATLIGGCAGSTSCGIKIFRFQVLYKNISYHVHQVVYPHGRFVSQLGSRPITDSTFSSVICFIVLYFFFLMVFALLLRLTGLDDITALSGAATLISNVGPGLGDMIGPSGNFAAFSDSAKIIGVAAMILGRLELFAVIILFMPKFWRH